MPNCTVMIEAKLSTGEVVPNAKFLFQARPSQTPRAVDGAVILPTTVSVTCDAAGLGAIALKPGPYVYSVTHVEGTVSGQIEVPNEELTTLAVLVATAAGGFESDPPSSDFMAEIASLAASTVADRVAAQQARDAAAASASGLAASTTLIAQIDREVDLLKIGPSEILTAGDPLITHWKAAWGIYKKTVEKGAHLVSDPAHRWGNAHPDFPVTIPAIGAYAGTIEIRTAGASTQNGAWVYQPDNVLAHAQIRFGTFGMAGEGHRAVMYMPMAFNFDPSAVTATSPETASAAGVVPHPWFNNALTTFRAFRPDPNKEGLTRIEHPSIGNDQTTRTITQKGHPVKSIWMSGTSTSTDIQMVGQLAGLCKKDGADFAYFGDCQERPSWTMDGAGKITVSYNQVTFPVGGDREFAFFLTNYTDDTYPTVIRRIANTGFSFFLKRHSDNAIVTSSTGVEFAFFLDWEVPHKIRSGAGGIRVEGGVSMVHAGEVVHNTASFGFMSMTPFKS